MPNNNDDVPVKDNFPNEYNFIVSTKTPDNYLATRKLPPQLSTREKKKVIKTNTPYSWIDG